MSLGNSNNKLSSAISKLGNCSNWSSSIYTINVSEWLIEFISITEKWTKFTGKLALQTGLEQSKEAL